MNSRSEIELPAQFVCTNSRFISLPLRLISKTIELFVIGHSEVFSEKKSRFGNAKEETALSTRRGDFALNRTGCKLANSDTYPFIRYEMSKRCCGRWKTMGAVSGARTLIAVVIAAIFLATAMNAAIAETMSPEEVAKLEPEICEAQSSMFRALTGALPFLVGSTTRSMASEQIALIDQYKPQRRRKVWVLRVPSAFVTQRVCDSGRVNYQGSAEDRLVTQIVKLSFLGLGDRFVPLTRATSDELKEGIEIILTLYNSVRDPNFLHGIYYKNSPISGVYADRTPWTCRDEPSNFPGLVTFRRTNPNASASDDCEMGDNYPPQQQQFRNKVFAKKLGENSYEFVALCTVNCVITSDYRGWSLKYIYSYNHLPSWQKIHEGITAFLNQHTAYLDTENVGR